MEILKNCLQQIKVPTSNDNIYSEECVFSFDTPVNKKSTKFTENCQKIVQFFQYFYFAKLQETDTGLYISLTSFFGFGKSHVERYYQKTNHAVFLHIQRLKTEVSLVSRLIKDDFALKRLSVDSSKQS